jgi:RNA polymerase sigma factor (sigma-70 family)
MPDLSTIGQQLRSALRVRDTSDQSDGKLLQSFIDHRDEAAMEALVRRHGPMVLGVCRRVLGATHDADDAFQATFLVLVRKAASVVPREMVGNWLHGVAYRTSLEARTRNARRRAKERPVTDMPQPHAEVANGWTDLQPLLDRELNRLPEKYRAPVILCELEGRSRKEVARQLNVPEGTLSSRLAMARRILARRLARRGVALSAGALGSILSRNAATASVPSPLVVSTVQAALQIGAGNAISGVVSGDVAALTQGVLKTMFLTKLKVASAALIAFGVLVGGGSTLLTPQAQAQKPDKVVKKQGAREAGEVSGVVKSFDAAKQTLTLHPNKTLTGQQSFTLAKEFKVLLDDGTGDKLGFLDGKASDVAEGVQVTLRLDKNEVSRIFVEGPTIHGVFKAFDAGKNTITASVSTSKTEPPADKTFTLSSNVRLSVEDGQVKDKTKPVKAPTLADIPANALVTLRLSANREVVGSIRAEGQSIRGDVKAVDGAKNTITVAVSASKGEPVVDRTFAVDPNAHVSVDEGKTKDKTKSAKLADVPVGSVAHVRLSLDQKTVVSIRAEGASLHGNVSAVDPAKDSITLSQKGEGDRTLTVSKDAAITLDGKSEARNLGDVPVGANAVVKLSPDGSKVLEIRANGPSVDGAVSGKVGPDGITIENKEGVQSFNLAKDVVITIEDRGVGTADDLIEGTMASLRLAADRSVVLAIHGRGPSYRGRVKAIDADKNVITLTIGGKNGVGGEDKEFKTSKDTVVLLQNTNERVKLTDPRVAEKDVILRMAIDQKAAAQITVVED